jgi:hypothetical protein
VALVEEGAGMSRHTLRFALARVAGWLIVPLYVTGVCASYLLERSAGLPNEHPVEDAALTSLGVPIRPSP